MVEDFFDIIYSMHVETGPNGEQIRKHAGQKRTYKAVSKKKTTTNQLKVNNSLEKCELFGLSHMACNLCFLFFVLFLPSSWISAAAFTFKFMSEIFQYCMTTYSLEIRKATHPVL